MSKETDIDKLYKQEYSRVDRNELWWLALKRAALRGVIRPDSMEILHNMYAARCDVDPERNQITLLGVSLDDAVDEIAKRMPLVQVAKDDPLIKERELVEQAALGGSVHHHGLMFKRFVGESGGDETLGLAKYRQWCAEHGAKPGLKAAIKDAEKAVNGFVEGDLSAAGLDVSPWSAEGWSITNQGEVVKRLGLEKAAAMAAQAGSKIGATHPSVSK
jgi:hypothetical protein